MKVFNKEKNKSKRKTLRNEMTEAERLLWSRLRRDQLGVRFRRQFGIGNYIADFYCPKKKLVIEIDGGQHFTEDGKEYDKIREEFMLSLGIKTIRFTNIEVMKETENVLKTIYSAI